MAQAFDEQNATADELWEWRNLKYKNPNPVVKLMIHNFFRIIGKALNLLEPDARVLEVGCGSALPSLRIHSMLRGRYFEVSDMDERYILKIHEHNFPFLAKQESLYSLERQNGEFDCVLCMEVLEHLEDYELAISEMFRVSSKWVLITVPNEPTWRVLNMIRLEYLHAWGLPLGISIIGVENRFGVCFPSMVKLGVFHDHCLG